MRPTCPVCGGPCHLEADDNFTPVTDDIKAILKTTLSDRLKLQSIEILLAEADDD